MKKILLASVLALTFIFPSFTLAQASTKANSPARKAAESITAAQMRDYLAAVKILGGWRKPIYRK